MYPTQNDFVTIKLSPSFSKLYNPQQEQKINNMFQDKGFYHEIMQDLTLAIETML